MLLGLFLLSSDKPAGQLPRSGSAELRQLQPRPSPLLPPHTLPFPFPSRSAPNPPSATPLPAPGTPPLTPPSWRPLAGRFTWLLPLPLGPQQREVAVGPQPAQQLHQQDQEGAARQRQAERTAPRHDGPLLPPPAAPAAPLSGPRRGGSRPRCLKPAPASSSPPPAAPSTPFPRRARASKLRIAARPPPRPAPTPGGSPAAAEAGG